MRLIWLYPSSAPGLIRGIQSLATEGQLYAHESTGIASLKLNTAIELSNPLLHSPDTNARLFEIAISGWERKSSPLVSDHQD